MPQPFNCPTCGVPLAEVDGAQAAIRCSHCNTVVIVPPELRNAKIGPVDEAGLRRRLVVGAIAFLLLSAGIGFWLALTAKGGDNPLAATLQRIQSTNTPRPTTTSRLTATPAYSTLVGNLNYGLGSLLKVGVDGDGNIYVGSTLGEMQVFTETGEPRAEWALDVEGEPAPFLAVDRQGAVYTIVNGNIYRYEGASGQPLGQVEFEGGPGFQSVEAVLDGGLIASWNSDGQGEVGGQQAAIVEFDGEGKVVRTLPGLAPFIVGVDKSGNIYGYTSLSSSIYKYTPDGELVSEFKRMLATAIAVDAAGRMFIYEQDLQTQANAIPQFVYDLVVLDADGKLLYRPPVLPPDYLAQDMVFNDKGELILVLRRETASGYRLIKYSPDK